MPLVSVDNISASSRRHPTHTLTSPYDPPSLTTHQLTMPLVSVDNISASSRRHPTHTLTSPYDPPSLTTHQLTMPLVSVDNISASSRRQAQDADNEILSIGILDIYGTPFSTCSHPSVPAHTPH